MLAVQDTGIRDAEVQRAQTVGTQALENRSLRGTGSRDEGAVTAQGLQGCRGFRDTDSRDTDSSDTEASGAAASKSADIEQECSLQLALPAPSFMQK